MCCHMLTSSYGGLQMTGTVTIFFLLLSLLLSWCDGCGCQKRKPYLDMVRDDADNREVIPTSTTFTSVILKSVYLLYLKHPSCRSLFCLINIVIVSDIGIYVWPSLVFIQSQTVSVCTICKLLPMTNHNKWLSFSTEFVNLLHFFTYLPHHKKCTQMICVTHFSARLLLSQ